MRRRVLAAAVLFAACARPEPVSPVLPISRAPDLRVGVALDQTVLTLGGGEALALSNQEAGFLGEIPAGETASVTVSAGSLQIRVRGDLLAPGPAATVTGTRSASAVRLNGRDYRGSFRLQASGGRITAVNVVDLEEYLVGVLGAELGRRAESELAALQAQAVVSRTVALQRAGAGRERGGREYDILATVSDQAYAGVGASSDLAERAVATTRGQVLTYQGRLIDAFFHSTCGGRTASGPEVFAAADRPYLRSVSDLDPGGRAWCAISPRFRWRESWSGEQLSRTLRETLPLAGGAAALADGLRDLRVLDRTPSGRVARLEVRSTGGTFVVTGAAARAILRPPDGGVLWSADFALQVSRDGERIVGLQAEGAGAGHGVGFCQWGAIGRARAGYSYGAILSAYFPGTEVTRTY
jgi:stage II sporulation protein D